MSNPENRPEIHSAIAEAIRNKRGERRTTVAADLEAMEAALVAEIEAFELRTASPQAQDAPPAQLQEANEKRLFPEIVSDGIVRNPRTEPKLAGTPAPEVSPNNPTKQAPQVGVLEHLRRQVQAQQQDDSAKQRELAAQEKRMDAALRSIFTYCHELVQQLNILHPPIGRQYSMLGSFAFSDLEWKQGFADYRTRPDSAEAIYETVSVSCQLSKGEQVQIERDGISADNFRKSLFDQGLVFSCNEIRNARQMVEKVIFSIAAEVRINLRWRADPGRGVLVLEARNLERFGSLSYELKPESVSQAMLDELARLLLGQPNRFRDFCSNLGPSAHSR